MTEEKYKEQLRQFSSAVERLKEVLQKENTEENIVRDSAIQRFEFCSDLMWKVLKSLLLAEGVECRSPKSCMREAFSTGIIPDEPFYLEIIDMRNASAHTYKEQLAQKMYEKLPKALELFEALLDDLYKSADDNDK